MRSGIKGGHTSESGSGQAMVWIVLVLGGRVLVKGSWLAGNG